MEVEEQVFEGMPKSDKTWKFESFFEDLSCEERDIPKESEKVFRYFQNPVMWGPLSITLGQRMNIEFILALAEDARSKSSLLTP